MNEPCFYRVSVKGIVIDDTGRILLAREGDKWEMLGGGLDHGEDPKKCLAREIFEETGLKVTSTSEQPIYFLTSSNINNTAFVANAVYQITLENLDFKPSKECEELRFFSANEMQHVKLFPNVQKLLEIIAGR